MTDLLVITTLDVIGRQNNREHHVIKYYKPAFDKVTVVYRTRRGADSVSSDFFSSQTTVFEKDGTTYFSVDPPLNPSDGAVRKFVNSAGKPSLARRSIAYLLDTIAIMRDALSVRALTKSARKNASGSNTVCLAFGPWASMSADALRRAGIIEKYVYVDRDFEPGFMASHPRRLWAKWAEFRAARRADLTLSIGDRLAWRFSHLKNANVVVSPTGVDATMFTATQPNAPVPQLIFVGEVAPWSGIAEALDAMRILKVKFPNFQLHVFGPALTAFEKALKTKAAEMQLEDTVFWYGNRPRQEVAYFLAQGGIGLAVFRPHPLRIHAAPLKILEYMASGLPVLALEGSQAGDFVAQTQTGLICQNNANSIAAAVTKLLDDHREFVNMSKRGPQIAAEFEWSTVLAQELDLVGTLYGLNLSRNLAGALEK